MSVHWCWGLTVQSIIWSLHRPQRRRLLSLVGSGTVPPWCCEIAGLYEVSVIGLIHNTSCSTHTWQAHLLLLHTHTHDVEQEHWDAQTDLAKPGGLISTLKGGGGGVSWLASFCGQGWTQTSLQFCGTAKTEWVSICVLSGQTGGQRVWAPTPGENGCPSPKTCMRPLKKRLGGSQICCNVVLREETSYQDMPPVMWMR